MRSRAFARAFGVLLVTASSAAAEPWDGWDQLESEIGALIEAEASARQARYPKNIDIRWRARRIGDFDFGAPVIAAAAVQLDGAGPEELVILTTAELVVVRGVGEERPDVAQRLALSSGLALARQWPRDPRGEIAVVESEGAIELWARSSAMARGVRLAARSPLAIAGRFAGYPACGAAPLKGIPGRGLLVARRSDLPAVVYAVRCARGFYDPAGQPQRARAVLDASGTLTMSVLGCKDGECDQVVRVQAIADAGTAFASADIDRDGLPELVAAAGGAPGGKEKITVFESRTDRWRAEHHVDFKLGAAAVVIGQFDDDEELEVLSLHREFRTHPVELWLWN